MTYKNRLFHQLTKVESAYRRYPLTMLLLILLTSLNAWNIHSDFSGYERIALSLVVAIFTTLIASKINEYFIQEKITKWALLILALVLAGVYYLLLPPTDSDYFIVEIKSAVLVFTLFLVFIWIPSIKNLQRYFYHYFLVIFKYSFTTILYGMILTLGLQAILSTVDYLFFPIPTDYFAQMANLIWFLWAPGYFLSLIPVANISHEERVQDKKAFELSQFLKILINYILIPLIGIYTLILLAYIALNIRSDFWTDNLLEPMFISYTISLLIIYLLALNIEGTIANFFRKFASKIMLFIVLFQSVASLLKIKEMGISHGRYYVILFGVFSLIAGLVFNFLPKEKVGLIVPPFILLACLSLIPPIDAFTVAQASQRNLLEETLNQNQMLQENTIQANSEIEKDDKIKITMAMDYLNDYAEIEDFPYLPNQFEMYQDFEQVFGFPMTYEEESSQNNFYHYASLDRSDLEVVDVSADDYFIELFVEDYDDLLLTERSRLTEDYFIQLTKDQDYPTIQIEDKSGESLLSVELAPLFEEAFILTDSNNELLSQEQMTLVAENELFSLKVLALELSESNEQEDNWLSGHFYLFVQIKD